MCYTRFNVLQLEEGTYVLVKYSRSRGRHMFPALLERSELGKLNRAGVTAGRQKLNVVIILCSLIRLPSLEVNKLSRLAFMKRKNSPNKLVVHIIYHVRHQHIYNRKTKKTFEDNFIMLSLTNITPTIFLNCKYFY